MMIQAKNRYYSGVPTVTIYILIGSIITYIRRRRISSEKGRKSKVLHFLTPSWRKNGVSKRAMAEDKKHKKEDAQGGKRTSLRFSCL